MNGRRVPSTSAGRDGQDERSNGRLQTQPLRLSAAELADLLGISARTVWRLDASGKLPKAVRIGGAKRWRRVEIEAFVNAGCPPRDQWNWPEQ
jgi:excisionase family DNA binding protein